MVLPALPEGRAPRNPEFLKDISPCKKPLTQSSKIWHDNLSQPDHEYAWYTPSHPIHPKGMAPPHSTKSSHSQYLYSNSTAEFYNNCQIDRYRHPCLRGLVLGGLCRGYAVYWEFGSLSSQEYLCAATAPIVKKWGRSNDWGATADEGGEQDGCGRFTAVWTSELR